MTKYEIQTLEPDLGLVERRDHYLARRMRRLRKMGLREELKRAQIEFEIGRRHPSDAFFIHRIRRHSLIEDNPCAG